ncbi:MAG: flagellar hook-associated protein FlgL [Janthinobacterium lividum]
MRITTSLEYQNLGANINTSLEALTTVQSQISSGKQLQTFSDDPAGAAQALVLRSALGDNAQYQRNATAATTFLTASEGALSSATSVVNSMRQVAVEGANSTQTPDSLAALGDQVDGAIQQLTQEANTQVQGRYLFGGTNTTTAPYDSTQTYQGNTSAINSQLGPNSSVQINTIGSTAFGPAFTALQSLKADLAAGDATAISGDIGKVDTALSALDGASATAGSKANLATAATAQLTRVQSEYQSADSDIENVDLAQAAVQLQSATNVYQASLAATAKAFQYSLSDFLH